jgi:predicted amidohydrolase
VTRIVCPPTATVIADLAANRRMAEQAIRRAAGAGADIVLLPELATSGYVFTGPAEARSVAVGIEHPLFQEWSVAAGKATVVGGFCELGDDGRLYNSAAVVDRTGVRVVYRKTHLWGLEKLIFTPGSRPPPIVETASGRVGLLICYDLEFPEVTRDLAVRGADLIVAPVNWPLVERPAGERPPETVIAMAAARTNRIGIAIADRSGTERGQVWTGGSAIIDECGWVVADQQGDPEAAVEADLDLRRARRKELGEHNHVLADRRPELYRRVTQA